MLTSSESTYAEILYPSPIAVSSLRTSLFRASAQALILHSCTPDSTPQLFGAPEAIQDFT